MLCSISSEVPLLHVCLASACRNVTLTAALGPDSMLDLLFVRSAVELCSICTFTFKDVAVANDRRGPGGAVEFFLGQPGARVVFDNAVRFRPACTAALESGAVGETPNVSALVDATALYARMHAVILCYWEGPVTA
jgi:hypothetical protein